MDNILTIKNLEQIVLKIKKFKDKHKPFYIYIDINTLEIWHQGIFENNNTIDDMQIAVEFGSTISFDGLLHSLFYTIEANIYRIDQKTAYFKGEQDLYNKCKDIKAIIKKQYGYSEKIESCFLV